MSNEPKVVDWANITDEEDDEDYSPVNEHSNEQIQQEEEQRDYEGDQGVEPVDMSIKKQISVQAVPMSAEELRESMINHIKNNQNPKVYLNLHGLDPSITEKDIRDFYYPLNIDRIISNQKKDMFDLEFSNKDDALKIVEKGTGAIGKCTFTMRMSRRTQYNERKQQDPNRRDKNGKGYGKKGQQRNYNKDRGDRGERGDRGGNYGLNRQGSYKGDYNQRDSYNQRGPYNQGNREDRGNYNYERQDSGTNRRRNDDRNQYKSRKDNYNQQQQVATQNVKPQVQEDEKQAEEAPKRFGFFNKSKEEELQREKQRQEELKKQEEEQAELKRQEELRLEKERQEEQQRQLQKQEEERQRKLKEEEQLREAQKNQVAQGEREGGQRGQEYPDNQKRGDRNYPRKDDGQRRKDYGGDRKYDNRQKNNRNQYENRKGDDYYQNYKGEENKQDTTPKYGQGNTSEQNKELLVTKRQSSYRSQGSGKYYSEKSGNYTPKYADFEEDWGYDDDYSGNYQKKEYQAVKGNARTPKGNSNYNYDETGKVSRKSSKPYDKESVVYMKKQESQPAPPKAEPGLDVSKHVSEPANKDTKKAKEEPAKKNPALPSSKNKVNPYDLLRGNT